MKYALPHGGMREFENNLLILEYIWNKRNVACNGKRIIRMIKRDEKYLKARSGIELETEGAFRGMRISTMMPCYEHK